MSCATQFVFPPFSFSKLISDAWAAPNFGKQCPNEKMNAEGDHHGRTREEEGDLPVKLGARQLLHQNVNSSAESVSTATEIGLEDSQSPAKGISLREKTCPVTGAGFRSRHHVRRKVARIHKAARARTTRAMTDEIK